MNKMIALHGLSDIAQVIHADIADLPEKYAKQSNSKWYDTETILSAMPRDEKIDLVIVDGPFRFVSPFARYPAIPFIQEFGLSENYAVFLDDTHRKEEQEIAAAWGELLQAQVTKFKRYTHISKGIGFDSEPFANSK